MIQHLKVPYNVKNYSNSTWTQLILTILIKSKEKLLSLLKTLMRLEKNLYCHFGKYWPNLTNHSWFFSFSLVSTRVLPWCPRLWFFINSKMIMALRHQMWMLMLLLHPYRTHLKSFMALWLILWELVNQDINLLFSSIVFFRLFLLKCFFGSEYLRKIYGSR